MSKSKIDPSKFFLSRVELKGFKSIEHLTIDLVQGLNILIGKNASGKSNFLEMLFRVLLSNSRMRAAQFKYAKLEFVKGEETLVWELEKEAANLHLEKDNFEDRVILIERLFVNGKKEFDSSRENTPGDRTFSYKGKKIPRTPSVRIILRNMGHFTFPLYIRFNIPDNLECLSTPGSIKINISDDYDDWNTPTTLNFLNDIFWNLELSLSEDGDAISTLKEVDKKTILKELKIQENVIENLRKYTPIQSIRFNENINIYKDDKIVVIENIKIDFKINSNWMPWSQLSDGTKRMFYMIAEISDKQQGLILVEEPELGIHPHQLNLVMQFLKEQSLSKQIFISTHSPQALNHLSEEELQNILITSYDTKKGTQIKHMTKPQMTKAKRYMKEVGFLSDYWMMSDLE